MKTQLKAKFLRYFLNKKQQEQGFTLIELLVVIIIIGILSAIALPSFLNQANKAKQSEGKTYVGSMNRAQQTYYLENGKFASNAEFDNLGLGIATTTTNYNYAILPATGATTTVTNQAQPKTNGVKAYIGGVKLGNVNATNEGTTVAVLCEAKLGKNATDAATGEERAIFDTSSTSGTSTSGTSTSGTSTSGTSTNGTSTSGTSSNTPSLTCPPTYNNLSNYTSSQ